MAQQFVHKLHHWQLLHWLHRVLVLPVGGLMTLA
jgi:hypothetical protein